MKGKIGDWFGNLFIWSIDSMGKRPLVAVIVWVLFIVLLGYGGWHLKRWFNWELGYSNDVQITVCEMIKPEALKDPSMCDDE